MLLKNYHATCAEFGVGEIRMKLVPDGLKITLLGYVSPTRHAEAEQTGPVEDIDRIALETLQEFAGAPNLPSGRLRAVPEPTPDTQAVAAVKTVARRVGLPKPTTLPLCKQCETQPVSSGASEFCGGKCAKIWYRVKR